MKELRLCIIGFGNAAQAFCKLLHEKKSEVMANYGVRVLVTGIAGRSKGSLLNSQGLDLQEVLASVALNGRLNANESELLTCDADVMIENCHADVLLELSTLSIADGQPAISHIEKAFEKGMHVITANKGPIAWDYAGLQEKAEAHDLGFLFETAVMDGTPVFNLVRETLPGCRILGFRGILNSTTNFMLEEMEKGNSYDSALLEAQRRGFAEAEPSLDVDGWDAAAKTAAIANVLMDAGLKPTEICRTGIGAITLSDIQSAGSKNKKIKLICEAYLENGSVKGRVHPMEIEAKDCFSLIDATSSILSIRTDLMGEISIIEKDPEIEQTAYGIFSDLLTLIKKIKMPKDCTDF
jgi:homoserine dehydrogenase